MLRPLIPPLDEVLSKFCGQLRIPAAVFLLVLSPPWGHTEATAGLVTYTWAPITGGGYFVTYPQNQVLRFSTSNGELTIGYDPDDLQASYIDVSTGSPGYGEYAAYSFTVSMTADYVNLTAYDPIGGRATASLIGNPGPLTPQGIPESLDSLLGDQAIVGAFGGFHDGLTFGGQSVPEPSSLLMLALGLGGLPLVYAVRRMKKRPGPRGGAGRS
jgi:hypothetical protein